MRDFFRPAGFMPGIAVIAAAVIAAAPLLAHDHTRKLFVQARAAAAAQAQAEAEPAPKADQAADACRLKIELAIDGALAPAAGLVRVTNLATGKPLAFSDEIQRDRQWHSIANGAMLLVPRSRLKVEAFHGLTTLVAAQETDLSGQAEGSVRLQLKTFYDPAARGLVAGNTHLHLMKLTHAEAIRYLETVPRSDGLDLVFLSYLSRPPEDRDYISNTFTAGDLGRLSKEGLLFGNGEEHRHNFGPGDEGYGHVMLLDILRLIEPVSIGPGITKTGTDGIPLQRGIRQARDDGAAVIWCHNKFGHEDIPNWAEGLVHAQNIFDGGTHGTYDDTFYRYLNLGWRVPFSTGTDWFIYDFSRVYLPLAGELTAKRWLEALAAGKSTITNGVFLELEAAGQPIGSTLAPAAGDEVSIVARAIGRNPFKRLELVHNGRVIHSTACAAKDGCYEATIRRQLKISEPGWIAVRIPTDFAPPSDKLTSGTTASAPQPVGGINELGKPLFAHTSPIYIELAGRRIFRPEVAQALIAEMEASLKAIGEAGTFADDTEREAVLGVYRRGIERMRKLIAEKR